MIVNRYQKEKKNRSHDSGLLFGALWMGNSAAGKVSKKWEEKNSRWISGMEERYRVKRETDSFLREFYKKKETALFTAVEIETINRCNGECPFCPVNRHDDKRKFAKMEEALFKDIILQLKELDYRGKLALHSNNEPFLDKRIVAFSKFARENLPHAKIYMYTNASLLTLDKYIDVITYLDRIVIDNYNDDLKLNENPGIIQEYCKKNRKLDKKTEIHLRKIHEVLSTRGGQSPNNSKKETLAMSCILPFKQVVVRPDGKISLCCNDPMGKYTMGDLNKEKLIHIWNSKKYIRLRNALRQGRKNISLCRYCDTLASTKDY